MDIPSLLISIGLALGLVLALFAMVWAWRGRRVDDHPICRRCRYDLFQLLENVSACPECGNELSGPRAVRRGNRRPRRTLALTSALIAVLLFSGIGLMGYDAAVGVNWVRVKPFAWILRSAVANVGAPNEPNAAELQRRLTAGSLTQRQVERLVDAALDVQHDRSISWPNAFAPLLNDLLTRRVLRQSDVTRYFANGLEQTFEVKPVIRRGRTIHLDLDSKFNRLTSATRFTLKRWSDSVTMGADAEIIPTGSFRGETRSPVNKYNSGHATFVPLRSLDGLADGPTTLDTTITYEIALTKPAGYAPITLRVPVSIPVQILPHDGVADRFVTDPSQAEAMERSWTQTRVETADDEGSVWLRINRPPVALSMAVWLRQGEDAWRFGRLHVEKHSDPQWYKVTSGRARLPKAGEVSVELRPDQAATDTRLQLDTYWGDSLTRDKIVVNEPYNPPFNMDHSLATAVEQAVFLYRVAINRSRKGPSVSASLQTRSAPVRLSYAVRIKTGTGWTDARDDIVLDARIGDNTGYGFGFLPLPDAGAATVDIMLVPNRKWEDRSSDPTPPWGYAILFEDVPLPDPAKGETPTGRVYGKAVVSGPIP